MDIKKYIKSQVLRHLLLVSGVTFGIKLIGFYKETLVAASFGLSLLLDTYFIAYLIPGFIQNVFISSFKSVFIPNYIAELKTGNNPKAFQSTSLFITIAISLILSLIALLFTDTYLDLMFPGHEEEFYNLVKLQFYIVLPCILIWGISALLAGLLDIQKLFRYTSIQAIFIPVSLIICLIFFKEQMGDAVLAIGTLIGSLTGFFYLLILSLRFRVVSIVKPTLNANIRGMIFQVPAKMTSNLFTNMHEVVDQFFAAQLIVGSITALNYSLKIPAFIIGILVVAINTVLLPHFTEMVLSNKRNAFIKLFNALKKVFLGVLVITIIGIFSTEFFVSLFFERNQFTSQDAQLVSILQKIILIYLPFKIGGMLMVNFLTSINKNYYLAIVSIISLSLNILLDFVLIKSYGIIGIAVATTIVVVSRNILLFFFTVKQYRLIK